MDVNLYFLVIFGITGTNAEMHSLRYMYTATSGIPDFPEFISVGMLDEQHFVYYDSNIKKMTSRQPWINNLEDSNYWESETQISKGYEQLYKTNIEIAKYRFNHTGGVHTLQKTYGCVWDDKTGETNGDRMEGYDGEDLLYLDLKELTWVSPVQQGFITKNKWDNDKDLLERDKRYFNTDCTEWLKRYLQYRSDSLKRTDALKVSLLQKDPSSPVTCHATGFYPSNIMMSWKKNDDDHHEDVWISSTLPNADGTFQKSISLSVKSEEWKKNPDVYRCVIQHVGAEEEIVVLLNEKNIKSNSSSLNIIAIVVVCLVALAVVAAVIGLIVWKKRSNGYGKTSTQDTASENSDQPLPKK